MSPDRVSKRSSTLQHKSLADKIRQFGLPAMVACSGCLRANVLCVFGKESVSCAHCVSSGLKCDGNFSEKEWDTISQKKKQLQERRAQNIVKPSFPFKKQKILKNKLNRWIVCSVA